MAARKKPVPEPEPNAVRRNLIEWSYKLNKKGGAAKGMRDLCKGIKEDYGCKAPLVKEHLTFLTDLSYIRKESEMTTVRTGETVRDQAHVTYRIGAKGIEFMEGKSEFSDRDRYPGINISATGGSTIVLGDGNVVDSNFRPLYDELGKLLLAVTDSTSLNDAAKLEASVSIETIKDQLALAEPDQTIVEQAWATAGKVCTTASLAEIVSRLGPMVAGLFAQ